MQFTRFKQNTNTLLFKGSLVSQLDRANQVKTGLELSCPGRVRQRRATSRYDVGQHLVRHIDEPPDFPAPATTTR